MCLYVNGYVHPVISLPVHGQLGSVCAYEELPDRER